MGNYIVGIFSVPKYKSEDISSLPFTANDGVAMKELFNKHFGIDDADIDILGNNIDQEIHTTDILKRVLHISRIAEPEDTLIFYFSGHGFSDGNIGYLATFDTDLDLPKDTSISIPRIKEEFNKSKAKRKILIIDSCYSGIGTGKKFPAIMSKDFEDSLFSDLSQGWVVFASCTSNEMSYFIEDKSMSVFSFYLIEGLKGNADSDGDSRISLEDLNTYVTKNVQKWAIANNKFQTPNINMEFIGTLTFAINYPEISEPLPMESEIGITEGSAQSIELSSKYSSPKWIEIYDEETFQTTGQSEEVPEKERIRNLGVMKEKFIGNLFASLINHCKPSQIKIIEDNAYELPFGKIVNTSSDIFTYEFKLIITKDIFTPLITTVLNSLDAQSEMKWNSIEYTFNGNFDFDTIIEIIRAKGYSILEYQLKKDYSYLTMSPKKESIWAAPKWKIHLINETQQAKFRISNENGLADEFFQTIPIAELIEIFSPSVKNINM